MLVVKTTSATAGSGAASTPPTIRPRKRVPSSRRRNPGSAKRVSAANLFLGSGSWRFRLRSCRRCRSGCGLERNCWSGCRRRRNILGLRSETLLQHGARSRGVGRHQLKNETETEEDAATPPADFGKEISGLTDADKCVG